MSSANVVDDRVSCKYGANCYQKNPLHHQKYKHPGNKRPIEASPLKTSFTAEKKAKLSPHSDKCTQEPQGSPQSVCIDNKKENVPETSNQSSIVCDDIPEEFLEEFGVTNVAKDAKAWVEKIFCMEMPEDFYSFFEFTKSLTKSCELSIVGLYLVGPYDLLSGVINKWTKAKAFLRYRYYYDPPEFQTILKWDTTPEFHLGYFRDDPKEMPVFVASNDSGKDCKIKIYAENIFGAVNTIFENQLKAANPFLKMKIKMIQTSLQKWSRRFGFPLDPVTTAMRARRSKVLSKTFHSAGLVVPYNKETEVGYRELVEDDTALKKILKGIVDTTKPGERSPVWAKLQPVITFANIANDECDFGACLELGLDLFCFGDEIFHQAALHQLTTAYNLLGRRLYATIAKIHIANRKKGPDPWVDL